MFVDKLFSSDVNSAVNNLEIHGNSSKQTPTASYIVVGKYFQNLYLITNRQNRQNLTGEGRDADRGTDREGREGEQYGNLSLTEIKTDFKSIVPKTF